MRLTKTATTASGFDPRTDGELVRDAALGEQEATAELYRRHAEAAWRVAQAVARNRDDASDAVSEAFTRVLQKVASGRLSIEGSLRPYLMTAVRNAAIDNLRRGGRVDLSSSEATFDGRSALPEPQEKLFAALDTALIAAAFRNLPERWRSVLWLTEVEGMEPREVADVMQITPNNAAQLAVRARAALRTRFLQEHIGDNVEAGCRESVEKLGAYVSGKLAARDIAAVDQHLAGCAACRDRAAELEDIGSRLRKIVLPLPLVFAPKAFDALRTSAVTPMTSNTDLGGAFWNDLATRLHKPLAGAAAGLVAAGVIALGLLGPTGRLPDNRTPYAGGQDVGSAVVSLASTAPIATSLGLSAVAAESPATSDNTSLIDDLAAAPAAPVREVAAPTSNPSAPSGSVAPQGPAQNTGDFPLAPVSEAAPVVAEVKAEIVIEPVSAVISVGIGEGSCTDVAVADTAIFGCATEEPATAPEAEPAGNHVTVGVETEVTGEQTVTVPVPAL